MCDYFLAAMEAGLTREASLRSSISLLHSCNAQLISNSHSVLNLQSWNYILGLQIKLRANMAQRSKANKYYNEYL